MLRIHPIAHWTAAGEDKHHTAHQTAAGEHKHLAAHQGAGDGHHIDFHTLDLHCTSKLMEMPLVHQILC